MSIGARVGRESKLLGQKANPSSAQEWFTAKASSTLRLLPGCESVELAGGPRPYGDIRMFGLPTRKRSKRASADAASKGNLKLVALPGSPAATLT